jgi:hypothetical protein
MMVRGYLGSLFELGDMHVIDHVTVREPRYLLGPSSLLPHRASYIHSAFCLVSDLINRINRIVVLVHI